MREFLLQLRDMLTFVVVVWVMMAYVAWLLCYGAYLTIRHKAMPV